MVDRQHILDYLWADLDRIRSALIKEGVSPLSITEHLVDQLNPIQRDALKTILIEEDYANMRTPSPNPNMKTPDAPRKR